MHQTTTSEGVETNGYSSEKKDLTFICLKTLFLFQGVKLVTVISKRLRSSQV